MYYIFTDVDINSGPFCYEDENGAIVPVLGPRAQLYSLNLHLCVIWALTQK